MSPARPFLSLFLCILLSVLGSTGYGQAHIQDEETHYVLERYIDAMGGRAALERIKSVRLSGTVNYRSGVNNGITVIKKKPNMVRVVLDTGTIRFVQAYDGETAWFSRQSGRNVFHDRMRGSLEESFVREAPLENVLISPVAEGVHVQLGEDVKVAQTDCYQVIAQFDDGSKVIHYIEKETYLERRILEYDSEGELLAELIPGKFQSIEGVAFATQIVRLKDGKTISTLTLDDIEANVGILDSAFKAPVELPEQ